MDFYLLPVQYVKQLTSRSVRIDLSVPDNLKNIFIWKPGQFLRFRFEIDGEFLEREYSICTAPYEGIISIAVKVVSKPRVSEYVQKNVKQAIIYRFLLLWEFLGFLHARMKNVRW